MCFLFHSESFGLFHYLFSGICRHYDSAKLLCWCGVQPIIEEWLKEKHCIIYFLKIYFGCFIIWPVHKADTICWLSYCVDCGYIVSLKIDISRQFVLSVSIICIILFFMIWPVKNRTLCVSYFTVFIWALLDIEKWFNQTHCVWYFD